MTDPSNERGQLQAHRDKRAVALSSLLAAVALTAMKAGVGLATNSLGILSEALHSLLDLVATGITLWAVRISSQPADREHTYGHGKFENLSALGATLLLLATSLWIIYEGLRRLFVEEATVHASLWAFLVVIVSMVVDLSRARALSRVARKYQSQALEADALHFSTDVWSSAVVLLGLIGVLAAEKTGLGWLASADAVAALGVALIVVWVSARLGKKSVADLLDAVPKDLQAKVVAAVAGVPGVEQVKQVRVRRSGPEVFADVTLTVDHATGLEQAHAIADQTEAAVHAVLPRADVVLHVEPTTPEGDDLPATVRSIAARHALGAHGVRLCQEGDQRWLELHIEVSESLTLDEAHHQATEFEQALRSAIPGLDRVVTHIEPASTEASTQQALPATHGEVHRALRDFFAEHGGGIAPHEVTVQMVEGALTVSLHCHLDPATAITDAHHFTERLEQHLRSRIANLRRVMIHAEPEEGEARGEGRGARGEG